MLIIKTFKIVTYKVVHTFCFRIILIQIKKGYMLWNFDNLRAIYHHNIKVKFNVKSPIIQENINFQCLTFDAKSAKDTWDLVVHQEFFMTLLFRALNTS